ncbi:MAG: hypothetical protein RR290_00675 [Clostridia bacterium]
MEDKKFESETTKLWELYQKGLQFQSNIEMKTKANLAVDFAEGRQWPASTEKTKNLPRPVLNIIKLIESNKKSNILSSSIKMVFKPTEIKEIDEEVGTDGADKFTKFAGYVSKDLKQQDLDDKAITDAIRKGSYIYHYFWDSEKYGNTSKYSGGLNGEIIDALNVFFSNPNEKDEQKQKWIMVSSRENIESLKKLAEVNKIPKQNIDEITSEDNSEVNYDKKEQENEQFTTVLTRYFRINGEVFFEKATKNVVVQPATALTPNVVKLKAKNDNVIEEDEADTNPDIGAEDNKQYKMNLYPIVIGQWEEKEDNIYGRSLVEELIPNQKAINFNYAMTLLSIQNIGFPKIKIRKDALKGKNITNAPGEVITDYSPDGNGITYMTPPPFSSGPIQVTDSIIDKTRAFNGATEVVSGEVLGANMSGSAIAALQTQAKVPIEVMQKKFWRVHEKIARVWEQFFKIYYNDDRTFIFQENGKDEQENFNGTEYQDVEFSSTIEIGAGSMYSEVASVTVLENMYQKGDITFDQYIELYPTNLMPFKEELKRMRQKERLPDEISQMIMQNPQIYEEVMMIIQQAQTPLQGIPGQALNQSMPII